MNNYKIISDSAVDFTLETIKKLDIETVPFSVTFDDSTYFKEMIEITPDEFYARLLSEPDAFPKTSLPNSKEYMDVFEKYLKNGQDVLCFTLANALSGSYQSALGAKKLIEAEYPDRKIIIINSTTCSITEGGLVLESCKMKEEGFTIEKNAEICAKIIEDIKVYFTVDSLEHLQKGGRIGKVASIAGTLLNVKPVIRFSQEELIPVSKIRGRKKALKEVAKLLTEDLANTGKNCHAFLCHTACKDDYLYLKDIFENEYNITLEPEPNFMGITIGSHHGPTSIGCGYLPSYKNFI